jgi:hypothetical protein
MRLKEDAMDQYERIMRTIVKEVGEVFRAGTREEIAALRRLGMPEGAVRFYERHAPARCVAGQVRIWAVEDVVEENTQAVPGICVQPHGYVVFASTFCGDAYCFDGNRLDAQGEPEIVLVSHESVREGASAEEVRRGVKRVAGNLVEFLGQFALGEVDEECGY